MDIDDKYTQAQIDSALTQAHYMQFGIIGNDDHELKRDYTASDIANMRAEAARQAARQAVDRVKSSMVKQGFDWLTLIDGEVRVCKPINTDQAHHKAIVDACELFVRHLYDIGLEMPEAVPDIYRMLVELLERGK